MISLNRIALTIDRIATEIAQAVCFSYYSPQIRSETRLLTAVKCGRAFISPMQIFGNSVSIELAVSACGMNCGFRGSLTVT